MISYKGVVYIASFMLIIHIVANLIFIIKSYDIDEIMKIERNIYSSVWWLGVCVLCLLCDIVGIIHLV